jgi:hypothetical protein
MKNGYLPPPPPPRGSEGEPEDELSSYFHRTTVVPLYTILKKATKKDYEYNRSILVRAMCCCRKMGTRHFMRNSNKINYGA